MVKRLLKRFQIFRRELTEIRESSSQEKHVSISVSEKHKRELEQLIKETELLKRENRRIREESKQKGKYDFLNGHQAN